MYPQNEVEISSKYLETVFNQIEGAVCLIGGWATYHLVNDNFFNITGRNYLGSRDIDIGFFINDGWTDEELRKSELSKAINSIKQLGFERLSYRFIKDFHYESKIELTPDEAAKLPFHEISRLYIDLLTDKKHKKMEEIIGFTPIDEPLLSEVFKNGRVRSHKLFGTDIMLPETNVLVAMKLKSADRREKDDKRIKDIADVFSLLWFSDEEISSIRQNLFTYFSKAEAKKTISGFKKEEITSVSKLVNVSQLEIKNVFNKLT